MKKIVNIENYRPRHSRFCVVPIGEPNIVDRYTENGQGME